MDAGTGGVMMALTMASLTLQLPASSNIIMIKTEFFVTSPKNFSRDLVSPFMVGHIGPIYINPYLTT